MSRKIRSTLAVIGVLVVSLVAFGTATASGESTAGIAAAAAETAALYAADSSDAW